MAVIPMHARGTFNVPTYVHGAFHTKDHTNNACTPHKVPRTIRHSHEKNGPNRSGMTLETAIFLKKLFVVGKLHLKGLEWTLSSTELRS